MGEIPRRHPGPADGQDGDAYADNEHQPAHGRGARLGSVPLGPHLPNFLSRLQTAQAGEDYLSAQQRR